MLSELLTEITALAKMGEAGCIKAGGIENGPFLFVAEARNFLSKPHQKLLSLAIIKNTFLTQMAPQTSDLNCAVFLTYL